MIIVYCSFDNIAIFNLVFYLGIWKSHLLVCLIFRGLVHRFVSMREATNLGIQVLLAS